MMAKVFGGILWLALCSMAWAQESYPSRPISMVVPFPPGGSVDAVARRVAQKMGALLGQPIVVENRAGAGGTIGSTHVAKSSPDGYTLMWATSSALAVSPALYKNLAYDPLTSFVPVIEICRGPFILSVRNTLPVKSAPELVELAKKSPGKLNYGSAGQGSAHHLATETFRQAAGVDIVHVPYKGGAPAWVALIGGEIDMLFDSMPGPLMNAGRARPIGVTGSQRLAKLPDVPTFAEQGIKGVDYVFFFGIVAPAGTPADVVAKLNRVARDALADPEVRATFDAQSLDPSPGSPQEFAALLAQEVPRFRELVKRVGLTLQ
ncbi:MAG TPA: tripartite tricarboxylate transporter substrate binding protein [Burkholderiaceae bacterium]|nr:tripartite tricarboxylate transporter substrate binding protein [Burkholderiaceae bacterium]